MTTALTNTIETEEELNGLWIAEVIEIPGAIVYGVSTQGAIGKVQALALRGVGGAIGARRRSA